MTAPFVLFAGSSAVEPTSPLPAALAAELGLTSSSAWRAIGIRGSRLARWARPELPADVAGRTSAIVVLLTANDPHPTADAVRAVDRALRRHAPTVVWLPPMPYPEGSRVEGRDILMRAALEHSGVRRADRSIRLAPAHWAPDRIHLTRDGYHAYAAQVGPLLVTELAPSPRAPSAPSREVAIARVHTGGGRSLPVTGADFLWLARAVAGEGGTEADAYAVASTLIRRWAFLRDADSNSPFRKLADLVVGRFAGADPYGGQGRDVVLRGYSQPVAVQWRDGSARRRRIRELGWDAIAPWRRVAVLRTLLGERSLTAAPAIHFASAELVARRLAEHPDWRRVTVRGARNHFVSTAGSRAMREPTVEGVGAYRVASWGRGPSPATLAIGGVSLALLAGVGLAAALSAKK